MILAETLTCFTNSLKPDCSSSEFQNAENLLLDNERIPAALALKIYMNNTSGARHNALAAAYPACLRILGEDCFTHIANQFIKHMPSLQRDLNLSGSNFSEYLENWTTTQPGFSDYHYLGDLARLEWFCHMAYYADSDTTFDFELLASADSVDQKELHFQLGSSVNLLESDYPVMELQRANISGGAAISVSAENFPEHLVIARLKFQATITRTNHATFDLLSACRNNDTLGAMIENDINTEALPKLIQRGWIAQVARGN